MSNSSEEDTSSGSDSELTEVWSDSDAEKSTDDDNFATDIRRCQRNPEKEAMELKVAPFQLSDENCAWLVLHSELYEFWYAFSAITSFSWLCNFHIVM